MRRKAGRPPKAEGDKKSAHLSIRVSARLRDELEAARRRPDGEVSLSEQVEQMLWSALTAEADVEKRLGGPTTSALLSIIADGVAHVETFAGGEHWLDNRYTFEQVRVMIDTVLDHLKPRGRRVLPESIRKRHPLLKADAKIIGQKTALHLLTLLDAGGNRREEVPTELPPPRHYFDVPLARRLRGSLHAEQKESAEGRLTEDGPTIRKTEKGERK
jgi:hypothetical protein